MASILQQPLVGPFSLFSSRFWFFATCGGFDVVSSLEIKPTKGTHHILTISKWRAQRRGLNTRSILLTFFLDSLPMKILHRSVNHPLTPVPPISVRTVVHQRHMVNFVPFVGLSFRRYRKAAVAFFRSVLFVCVFASA